MVKAIQCLSWDLPRLLIITLLFKKHYRLSFSFLGRLWFWICSPFKALILPPSMHLTQRKFLAFSVLEWFSKLANFHYDVVEGAGLPLGPYPSSPGRMSAWWRRRASRAVHYPAGKWAFLSTKSKAKPFSKQILLLQKMNLQTEIRLYCEVIMVYLLSRV